MTLTRTELQAANAAENPHAGKGQAVVLEIGGDIGALVVTMPAADTLVVNVGVLGKGPGLVGGGGADGRG